MSDFFSGLLSVLNPVRGSGNFTRETRSLEPFHGVVLQTSGDLNIRFGEREEVELHGEDNILPLVETSVQDGLLKIRFRPNTSISTHRSLQYVLTCRKLDRIETTGSGEIDAPAMQADVMSLVSSGSGSILTGNIESGALHCLQTSSGGIEISGLHSRGLKAEIKGSGNLRVNGGAVNSLALRLTSAGCCEAATLGAGAEPAAEAQVEISGSGDAHIGALKAIETSLHLSSSGSLEIGRLDTGRLAVKVSGSGNLSILEGQAASQHVDLSSAGKYLAHDLLAGDQAAEALVRVSGSGNAFPGELNAIKTTLQLTSAGHVAIRRLETEQLQASIKGSGNLSIESGATASLDLLLTSAGLYNGQGLGAASQPAASSSVRVKGSGNARVGWLNAKEILLLVESAGDLRVEGLQAELLECETKGSGDVKVRGGAAQQANLRVTSAGGIHTYEMAVQKAEVRSAGSGDVKLQVQERLDVKILSSGGVTYRGSPILVYAKDGSGEVRKSSGS